MTETELARWIRLEVVAMLVREAMTTQVVTITPEESLRTAARLLSERSITAMPVVDDSGELVGVVSEADVVRESLVPDPRAHLRDVSPADGLEPVAATSVGEVMTAMPLTVHPDDDLADAVRLMTDSTVKSLPVVEEGRVVGVVSRRDVVAQLARSDEAIEAEIGDLVSAWAPRWEVEVHDGVVTFVGIHVEEDREIARTLAATVRGVTGITFR